jgi:hypothetical protein
MRVELFDSDGNRYTVAFEGQITRDKALRLLDLVELLGGMPEGGTSSNSQDASAVRNSSRIEKVHSVIQKSFPMIWFSSKEVLSVYEADMKEPISLSTVSTYLARLSSRGLLLRTGGPNALKYKMASNIPQAIVQQRIK